nr:MAG TPA: DNA-directed RNA polymerase subunit beta' [Caudoviricetes sp.]
MFLTLRTFHIVPISFDPVVLQVSIGIYVTVNLQETFTPVPP